MIETFVDKAEDQPHIGKQFVQPMMDPILGDYAWNVPDARESEVLSLFATIINKYVPLSLTHSHTHTHILMEPGGACTITLSLLLRCKHLQKFLV